MPWGKRVHLKTHFQGGEVVKEYNLPGDKVSSSRFDILSLGVLNHFSIKGRQNFLNGYICSFLFS